MNPQKLLDRHRYLAVGSLSTWNHNQVLYLRTELHSRLWAVYLKPQWQALRFQMPYVSLGVFSYRNCSVTGRQYSSSAAWVLLTAYRPTAEKGRINHRETSSSIHTLYALDPATYKHPGFLAVSQTCCCHSGLWPPAHEPHFWHCLCLLEYSSFSVTESYLGRLFLMWTLNLVLILYRLK